MGFTDYIFLTSNNFSVEFMIKIIDKICKCRLLKTKNPENLCNPPEADESVDREYCPADR
jgi:hypothetical protein